MRELEPNWLFCAEESLVGMKTFHFVQATIWLLQRLIKLMQVPRGRGMQGRTIGEPSRWGATAKQHCAKFSETILQVLR